MRLVFMVCMGLSLVASLCIAGEPGQMDEQKSRDSYALGYDFGSNLKRQGIDIDSDTVIAAFREALEGRKPALSPEEMTSTLVQLRKTLMKAQERRFQELAATSLKEGRAFLEANKLKDGVRALPSGLQYRVLSEGGGPFPKPTDSVTVHYRGRLVNGQEFDSSFTRGEPATLSLAGVIDGWREALQLMRTGSKWQLFIPPDLAYGQRQFGRIPPNATLVFDIELIDVKPFMEATAGEAEAHTAGTEVAADKGQDNFKRLEDRQ